MNSFTLKYWVWGPSVHLYDDLPNGEFYDECVTNFERVRRIDVNNGLVSSQQTVS
jgi:hypothetical protein